MFTTKNKLAEQVIRRLNGGDISDDAEQDPREVILFIEQAVAVLVKENYIKTLLVEETSVDPKYIAMFKNVPVLQDKDIGLSYSETPYPFLDLHADRGIHHVSMMKEQGGAFVPIRNGSVSLYSHSPAKNLEGRIGYWPEAKRIYYSVDLVRQGCDKVLVKLIVPSPSELDDDEPYPIGSDMELPVIERVLALMGVNSNTDDVNDNTNK